jgi:hypothetical protein
MSKAGVEVGTALACPKCNLKFKAAAPEEARDDFEVVDEQEEAPKKPARPAMKKQIDDEDEERKPSSKRRVVKDDDEAEDDKPRAKRRVVRDDDEDEEKPRPKKRQQDEEDDDRPKAKKSKREDDDDRPRKKKKKSRRDDDEDEELGLYAKLKGNIWVRAGVLGVLITVLGIVAYLRLIKNQEEEAANPVEAPKQQQEDYSKPITKDQLQKFPKEDKNFKRAAQ